MRICICICTYGDRYEDAAKCYSEQLKRSEREGMAPQILWQSCLMVVRFLGDAGEFEEAETILGKARELSKELGGGDKFVAEVSLRCAELLNKWAASTPEYSTEIVVRSAVYAKEATDILAYMIDPSAKELYGTALYWMGLNFSTLCRIGGGGGWSAQRAWEMAEQALDKCAVTWQETNAAAAKKTEALFGQGVFAFCKAEAMAHGHVTPQGGDSIAAEAATTASAATEALLEAALQIFSQCYDKFSAIYSPDHLDAIKCVSMMGIICIDMCMYIYVLHVCTDIDCRHVCIDI